MRENRQPNIEAAALASLMLSIVDGKILRFVRSEFKILPNTHWQVEWHFLKQQIF